MIFKSYIKKPNDCSPKELDDFKNLLMQKEGIEAQGLSTRINRSFYLAFYYFDSLLIGIGAVKMATVGFRKRLLAKHETFVFEDLPEEELGWFYVKESFRGKGIGKDLISLIMNKCEEEDLFSVTSPDNKIMIKLIRGYGFSCIAEAFSETYQKYLIYFRENDL